MVEASEYLPDLQADLGFTKEEIKASAEGDSRGCYTFIGGEKAGLKRLNEYVFARKSVKHYNDTRNNLIGADYSSKLSPWLANGSLSIRKVYWDVREYIKKHG